MSKVQWKGSALLGPVPPALVTCGTLENPNVCTVAWCGIVNSKPPRTYISLRPSRHSHQLITNSGEFVIALPTTQLVKTIDYCGVKSGRDENKFETCNLTPQAATTISAPLIEQSPVCLECRVFQTISLGSHDMFLADIVAVNVEENLLDASGRLMLEKAGLAAYAHGSYFALGNKLGTFGYSVRKKSKSPAGKSKPLPAPKKAKK